MPVGIRQLLRDRLATMLRHPWSPPLCGRPLLGPNVLARSEYLFAALAATGLSGPDLVAAGHALANAVIGAALTRSTATADPDADGVLAAHPTLAAAACPHDWDAVFERGMDLLLAGLG